MNPWVIKSLCNKYTNLAALGLTNITVNGTTITFTLRDGQTASVTIPTPQTNYMYNESITNESETWMINHMLDTPWQQLTIDTYDYNNRRIYGTVDAQRSTNNLLVIEFSEKVKGQITIKK